MNMNQQPFPKMNNFPNFCMNQNMCQFNANNWNPNLIIPNNMNINNNNLFLKNNFMNNNMINCFGNNFQIMENNINKNSIVIRFVDYFRNFEKDGFMDKKEWIVSSYPKQTIKDLILKFSSLCHDYSSLTFKGKDLTGDILEKTVADLGIVNNDEIVVHVLRGGGGGNFDISIKFIKSDKYSVYNNINTNLIGLAKLCFLSEISSKFKTYEQMREIKKFSEIAYYIMKILSDNYIPSFDIMSANFIIKETLKKITGCNVINFSNFVDEVISSECIKQILNLLNKKDLIEINNIKMCLGKYNNFVKFFEKEFLKSLRQSIFEFTVISMVILDRDDYDIYKKERSKCPNKIDRLLYHGTQIDPISSILTGKFKKSEERCYQHGKGVYFTDTLDYCWYYGGAENNRFNINKIPKIELWEGDVFTAIVSMVYYNKNGYLKVKDHKTRIKPGKNEINFAYAGCLTETIDKPDYKKFYGTEYVIWDLDQICPFMSITMKRNEFCVIWRDDNFSEKPIYGSDFDKIFKNFLKERLKYIKQIAKFNVYPCTTTQEALNLVNRKKYNKIILISNVGPDYGGKIFIDNARKIIGNNVIALFLAYNIDHLKWIKNYKNAIFSNDAKIYEKYLDCFLNVDFETMGPKGEPKDSLKRLIRDLEKHYKVKFNFDNTFIDFPLYKESGKYSDLTF